MRSSNADRPGSTNRALETVCNRLPAAPRVEDCDYDGQRGEDRRAGQGRDVTRGDAGRPAGRVQLRGCTYVPIRSALNGMPAAPERRGSVGNCGFMDRTDSRPRRPSRWPEQSRPDLSSPDFIGDRGRCVRIMGEDGGERLADDIGPITSARKDVHGCIAENVPNMPAVVRPGQ